MSGPLVIVLLIAVSLPVVGWAAAVLAWSAYRLVTEGPAEVNWITAGAWAAVAVWFVRRRRALRRAIELDDSESPDAG